jgi:hypothetical protein
MLSERGRMIILVCMAPKGWKITVGEMEPLPGNGKGSSSWRVTISDEARKDDPWSIELEVVLSTRVILQGGPGLFARSITVRRPDGEPVSGRDFKRMPATRYVEAALAAVRLDMGTKAQAARNRIGAAPIRDWSARKAELERRTSHEAKRERGRGSQHYRRIRERHDQYTKERGSAWATKQIAREEKVAVSTVRVWLHIARKGKR